MEIVHQLYDKRSFWVRAKAQRLPHAGLHLRAWRGKRPQVPLPTGSFYPIAELKVLIVT
jgi:hypothetical protein